MDKFCVFVYMLLSDTSLKQRIPCVIRISIFGAFSVEKKCALYTGKYGTYTCSESFISNLLVGHKNSSFKGEYEGS